MAGCATLGVSEPVNAPIGGMASEVFAASRQPLPPGDEMMVNLAFSGGGTRAAAFAFGVLTELDQITTESGGRRQSLLDQVDFVSGVSGGAIAAAYFGLKKRAALADFREKFLLRNAEEGLSTSIDPFNLAKALGSSGVNDAKTLSRWLDANLFKGATFADLRKEPRPRVWINASDIYNRVPFIFGEAAFTALCSDLRSYPIADAVAASAAVPVVFTPMVLQGYPKRCMDQTPEWLQTARSSPNSPPMLKAYADAIHSYHTGSTKYVKLLDGGLVDNYGLSGFTIARLSAAAPYEPMTPTEAVNLRRSITILIDAGQPPSGDWAQQLDGPSGAELIMAAADTAVQASVRSSFTAFQGAMAEWQRQLVAWRCGLTAQQRKLYGAPPRWNCRDIKLYVDRIAFDQLGPERAKLLNKVDTRLHLPADQVDSVIEAGRDALQVSHVFQEFLRDVGGRVGTASTAYAGAQ